MLEPEELVDQAADLGLEVLAVTDHDTIDGLSAALARGQQRGITVVPGVEISATQGRGELHILGYFVDAGNPELQEMLSRTQEARLERAKKMLARLSGLGVALEWERVLELSGGSGSIGRPHVAASLLEAGYVQTFQEAFSLWIGRGCPAYVERKKIAPEEAVRLVRIAGGLPVLAHPYIYGRDGQCKASLDLTYWLPRLRMAGLEGIEIYYPNYPRRVCRQLLSLAIKYGLQITGGSDFHGTGAGNGLGSVAVPWAVWEGLKRRHRQLPGETGQVSVPSARPGPGSASDRLGAFCSVLESE